MGMIIQHTINAGRLLPRAHFPNLPATVSGNRFPVAEDTEVEAYASICKQGGLQGGISGVEAAITVWESSDKNYRIGSDEIHFTPDQGTSPDWAAQAWLAAKSQMPKYAEGTDVFDEGQTPPA